MTRLEDTPERIKRRAYEKAYREANKEKVVEKSKRAYQKNKEKILQYQKEYYIANKEKMEEKAKAYYKENKETINKKGKEYRDNHKKEASDRRRRHYRANKKKTKDQCKAWRQANPDKVAAYSDKYRRANLDKKAAAQKKYRDENPAIHSWRDATKRAWKGTKSSLEIIGLSSEDAKIVWHEKREIAEKYFPGLKLEHDHIEPLAKAETKKEQRKRNHFTNFVFIPLSENRKKYAKSFDDWFCDLQNVKLKKCIIEQRNYNSKFHEALIIK